MIFCGLYCVRNFGETISWPVPGIYFPCSHNKWKPENDMEPLSRAFEEFREKCSRQIARSEKSNPF